MKQHKKAKWSIVTAAVAAGCMLGSAGQAQASLLNGQTVGYEYLFPTQSTSYNGPYSFVVGAGVERAGLFGSNSDPDFATIDVSDTSFVVDFSSGVGFTPGAFNGFRLFDVNGTIGAFTGVTLNSSSNAGGFDASRISFDDNNIYVNWQGLDFNQDTVLSFNVNGGAQTAPVPEPETYAMMGMGLLMMVAMLRKKKMQAVAVPVRA